MRPTSPTFWLLDGPTGWRTLTATGTRLVHDVRAGKLSGIRLSAVEGGRLTFQGNEDSLGCLALPRHLAIDTRLADIYLLSLTDLSIKRFSPQTKRFQTLPSIGGPGQGIRQFQDPQNITIAQNNLYIADRGNRRVQAFNLKTLGTIAVWGPQDRTGQTIDPQHPDAWRPIDVGSHRGVAYVLDWRYGRVHRHRPNTDQLDMVLENPQAERCWTRFAMDNDGSFYLLNTRQQCLEVYNAQGQFVKTVLQADDVRDNFHPPLLNLDHKGRFCIPENFMHLCKRQLPQPARPETSLAQCPPHTPSGIRFDREGNVQLSDQYEMSGPKFYQQTGTWISTPLDSEIHNCQWHRIKLNAHLPLGTEIEISTYTDNDYLNASKLERIPPALWKPCFVLMGQWQEAGEQTEGFSQDGLVQNTEGRYLWIRAKLKGDGFFTPSIRKLRAHYPRDSYLKHLPAIFSANEESSLFLSRFLSIFQTDWDEIEKKLEEITQYFDPRAAPDGEALRYLADWLALPVESEWNLQQQRRLLSAAPALYPHRGTFEGIQGYLQVYLQNLANLERSPGHYPKLVEGFLERHHLFLDHENATRSDRMPLWGPDVVGRLQLDRHAREGEVKLVSTGDPQRDLFHEYAHKFKVFMPSSWIKTREDERKVRRAVEAEKPAHTQYDLCLVEPRLRIGIQSTVGIDTIIGGTPQAQLACRHHDDAPPSRPPRHRLGYDTLLGIPQQEGPGFPIGPEVRIGTETVLR